MKKNLKKVLVLTIVFVLLLVGCTSDNTNSQQNSGNTNNQQSGNVENKENNFPTSIVIASGPIGGPWYSAMTKVSEILMREIKGLTVSVIEGGAESNLALVNAGVDAQIGMTSSVAMQQCKDGSGSIEKMDNISALMPIVSSYIQVAVPENSDIKSFTDILGKNISAGKTGFASEVIFRQILDAYGISYDDIKAKGGNVNMVNWSEYPTLVGDGHLDLICLNGEVPHNIYSQIEVDKPLRLLQIGENEKKAVLEKMPALFTKEFEAGCYKGTKENVELFGYSGLLFVNNSLPDEFVLKIMELIEENKDEIISELPFVDLLGWENIKSGMSELVCRDSIWKVVQEKSK